MTHEQQQIYKKWEDNKAKQNKFKKKAKQQKHKNV